MAVVFGECGRECLSGPGNTEYLPAVPVRQQAGLLVVPARPALNRGGAWDEEHWCQMAEFRAAGPKNGPVKFIAA